MLEIEINLKRYHTIFDIIFAFDSIPKNQDISLHVLYSKGGFIDVAIYPLLCSIVNERRASGAKINIEFDLPPDCKTLQYAERMDFLSCLGLKYDYPFNRRDANGRFIEIFHIAKSNYFYPTDLGEVFGTSFGFTKAEIDSIVFVLGEIGCNCTMHSKSRNGAYFFCQKYPSGEYLDVYMVDSGVGIMHSMLNNPEFKGMDSKELLALSIQFEKGSGNGRGHGLFLVTEFLKRNQGNIEIISGNSYLKLNSNKISIVQYDNEYEGVYINMKIPFNIHVPITDIMDEIY